MFSLAVNGLMGPGQVDEFSPLLAVALLQTKVMQISTLLPRVRGGSRGRSLQPESVITRRFEFSSGCL